MKKRVTLILMFFCLLLSLIISISLGASSLSFSEVTGALSGEGEGLTRHIVYNIRLPRSITGLLVGTCLSLSGAVLQGIMRNSLASPNIIGVSSGAGLAAAVCLVLIPSLGHYTPAAAFIGAFAATLLIYFLSYKDGISPLRMVLAGIAVSSLISAVINLILIFYPDRVSDTLSFTIGSLSLASWTHVKILLPYAAGGFLLCYIFSNRLNVLLLGDELANSLGVSVEKSRFFLIALSSALAAASVSVAGLLGFVGLIVPHIVKLLLGSDYRWVIPGCFFLGGSLVMLCDTFARTVAAPMEIPVGITLAVLGVPFFLWLLRGRLHHA